MAENFYKKLEDLLKKDKRFVDKDGELLKSVVIDCAYKADSNLVELLLSEKELKVKFFSKIKDVSVFNINDFVNYVQDKNFLADSFTKYKNKIGLNIDGKFLNERNEVALVWPFKDCVLEGGMTKEDEKRKEIFFNEILAQDEIDKLFAPKVLANWKRYNAKGEEKVKEFKRDKDGTIRENLIIKGNNLLALHSLKEQFAGKVKLIYIDPPYNTGNDSFGYNDNFNHSTWLTFMKNRLEIARELLKDDGSIYISLGATSETDKKTPELGYLFVMLDEIFGRDNFIETLFILNNLKGNNNTGKFSNVGEFCLVYAKKRDFFRLSEMTIDDEEEIEKWQEDERGFWKVGRNLKATGENAPRQKRPTMYFPLYINDKDLSFSLLKDTKHTFELYPITDNKEMCWNWSKDQFLKEKRDVLIFRNKNTYNVHKKQRPEISDVISKNPKNIFYKPSYSNTVSAGHIEELFGKRVFNYSKSEFLIQDIVQINTKLEDIVMDFQLGSGTTCAVAHKMGRQYIGVEQIGNIEGIAIERMKKVIAGEQGGISENINWKGGGDFIYCELAKYNEEFVEKIQEAKDGKVLLKIWEEVEEKGFLNYNVDIKKFDETIEEFKKLSAGKQKEILFEMLNKNQLYVNLSEINDAEFKVAKEDKELNKQFYGSNK
jgi:adenine-specific DNA-methyltransferase